MEKISFQSFQKWNVAYKYCVHVFDLKCLHFSHLIALVFYLPTTLMMKTVNSRAKTTESIVILLRLKN